MLVLQYFKGCMIGNLGYWVCLNNHGINDLQHKKMIQIMKKCFKKNKRSSTNKEIKMERNHIFLKRGYGSIKKFGKQRWFGEQINWNEKESCFQDKGCRSIKENNNIYKRTKRVQRKEDHLIKKKNKNKR